MIQTEHDTAWEDIQLVIQKIEEKALKAQTRTDILFYSYGTLEQGKHVVQMGFNSTDGLAKTREGQNKSNWDGDLLELMGMFDKKEPEPGKPWTGSAADVASKYLRECYGCSFRMAFDYQLNPLALINPVLDAARNISAAIKPLEEALDPVKQLEKLCDFMEQLKVFCPQDLATVIMSLKMLLFSYASKALSIKLDWTTILGPILKAIAELLIAIVDAILNLALAPLDCVLGSLKAAESVEKSTRQLAAGAQSYAQQTGAQFTGGSAQVLKRDVQAIPSGSQPTKRNEYGLGSLRGKTTGGKSEGIVTGFDVKAGQPFDEAIKDPAWANATVMQKAVVSVGTARQHLVGLFDNIKITLDSLSQLVSGGVALNLQLGGVLLELFDLIGMLMMIIRMFKNVGNPKEVNWCEYLAENPEILREQLKKTLGENAETRSRVFGNEVESQVVVGYSVLVNGNVVGDIPLCTSSRDPQIASFLNTWIQELQQGV